MWLNYVVVVVVFKISFGVSHESIFLMFFSGNILTRKYYVIHIPSSKIGICFVTSHVSVTTRRELPQFEMQVTFLDEWGYFSLKDMSWFFFYE